VFDADSVIDDHQLPAHPSASLPDMWATVFIKSPDAAMTTLLHPLVITRAVELHVNACIKELIAIKK